MGERVEWSDLPKELLPIIGKSLETRVDVLRFRSVCSSWRFSIPLFHAKSLCFPLKVPHPSTSLSPSSYLCQRTLYRLQPLNPSTAISSSSSSSSSNQGCLIMVEESNPGELRLLEPLSNRQIRSSPLNPKTLKLNLLNCRIVELTKAVVPSFFCTVGPRSEAGRNRVSTMKFLTGVNKAVMFPNSAWTCADECAIFVLFLDGKLGFAKYGDEELTPVNDWSPEFDDIIVYKGQFYVVDRLGIVSWIDCSSLKLVQFSPPLCGLGGQKHLVESGGALYVLDRYLDGERRIQLSSNFSVRVHNCPKTVGFQVYRLDEEWGQWIREKSLGDKAFALVNDCSFSVSTRELFGFKGNGIYFLDGEEIYVFNLEDRSIKELVCPVGDFAPFGALTNLV